MALDILIKPFFINNYMINWIKNKIAKHKAKRQLIQFGTELKTFTIFDKQVQYAQWLHPYESDKVINEDMINFYKHYIPEGSLAIDIGAHTGDTTVPMALSAGKNGLILGLEPNPYVFKVLEENSKLNKSLTQIIPLNFAATDADGEYEFQYSDASFCNGGYLDSIENKNHNHNYTLKVQGRNFENYLTENYSIWLSKWSYLKVDAEGYDKEIIKSLKHILEKYKPTIVCECNKNLSNVEKKELYQILVNIGYKVSKLTSFESNKKQLIPNSETMTNWKHFDVIAEWQ
jgi:FkbM family methyltransferase